MRQDELYLFKPVWHRRPPPARWIGHCYEFFSENCCGGYPLAMKSIAQFLHYYFLLNIKWTFMMLESHGKNITIGVAQCLLIKCPVHSGAHGDILSHEGGLWQGRPTFLRLL